MVEVTELDGGRGWKYRARIGPVEIGSVALAVRRDAQDPLRGHWLMALSVRPAFRRIGVARLLGERVLRGSHEIGGSSVRLTVRQDNAPAIRLYESLGFARLDDIRGLESELKRLEDLSGAPYMAMEAQIGESQ